MIRNKVKKILTSIYNWYLLKTVESSLHVVAQYSCISWMHLAHEVHSSTLCIILKKTYIYWNSYSQKNTIQSNKFQLLLNIDPIHNYKKRSFFQSGNMFPSSYIFSMTKIMQEWENVYNIVYTQNLSCISFIPQCNNTYTIKLQNLNNIKHT